MNQQLFSILSSIHQESIFEGLDENQQSALLNDLLSFNSSYPGGIKLYIERALSYLSSEGKSSLPYTSIEIPTGKDVIYGTEEFTYLETLGLNELPFCCFAIVGGGIGERLGSDKPKLCLTSNLITGDSFLSFYFSYFRAIQNRFQCITPVVIMTSHKTHTPIQQELEEHDYYGLDKSHVHLLLQIEVPSISNTKAHLSIRPDGHLVFKPHGHGDIHTLLYQNQLPQLWKNMGKKRILFMQDTNILAIYGFASLLGVSSSQQLDFSSLGIVRKPGEKVGSICRVTDASGRQITCNIEYNEFETILKRITGVNDCANANGNSSFPGNINVLCVSIDPYIHTLEQSKGLVPEFINPKYLDSDPTLFQSPSRLECMMQDLPKIMNSKMSVGYCSLPRWMCFSAAKNSEQNALIQAQKTGFGESLFSMEEDFYKFFSRVLKDRIHCGNERMWDERTPAVGIPSTPVIVLSPDTALTISEMQNCFEGVVEVKPNSIIYLKGRNAHLRNVVVDGAAIIQNSVEELCIVNNGWRFVQSDEDAMRRYSIAKYETAIA